MSAKKPHDINMLRAKLRKALDAFGKSNGHQCPPTDSNVDPVMHELYVTSEASSYFKTRHEKARDEALRAAFDVGELDSVMQSVIKNERGESLLALEGQVYSMTVDISRPATKLDVTALQSYLIREHKMTRSQVDKAFEACTTHAKPATRVKVMSRG